MLRKTIHYAAVLTLFAVACVAANPAQATITLGQVDDFQPDPNGNLNDNEWGPSSIAIVEEDAGPNSLGDDALLVTNGLVRHGSLDILNEPSQTDQWNGNWTAEGVTRIKMDVRNPNDFELVLKLGLAGTAGPGAFYSGDSYLSANAIMVPADDLWHTIFFNVEQGDWADFNGSDIGAALQDVTHLRVIHNLGTGNPPGYKGGGGLMYLDNITAIPEPGTFALLAVGSIASHFVGRRRKSFACR
jgi:hypothetical protein